MRVYKNYTGQIKCYLSKTDICEANVVVNPGTHISMMLYGPIPLPYRERCAGGWNDLLKVVDQIIPLDHRAPDLMEIVKAVQSFGKRIYSGDQPSLTGNEFASRWDKESL